MSITRKKKQNGLFYTKAEERINTLSHAAGILMGVVVGTIFLVKSYQSGNFWAVFGIWLYLFGMLGSYVASTLYHALKYHNPWKSGCGIGTMRLSTGILRAVIHPSHSLHCGAKALGDGDYSVLSGCALSSALSRVSAKWKNIAMWKQSVSSLWGCPYWLPSNLYMPLPQERATG